MRLKDKVAIITGGSRGIGRAIDAFGTSNPLFGVGTAIRKPK